MDEKTKLVQIYKQVQALVADTLRMQLQTVALVRQGNELEEQVKKAIKAVPYSRIENGDNYEN